MLKTVCNKRVILKREFLTDKLYRNIVHVVILKKHKQFTDDEN